MVAPDPLWLSCQTSSRRSRRRHRSPGSNGELALVLDSSGSMNCGTTASGSWRGFPIWSRGSIWTC